MSEQIELPLPEKPVCEVGGEGYFVYLIECQTPNHWYVGMSFNLQRRWNQHWAGYGSVFIREHGFKRVAKTWGPFPHSVKARQVEDEKREQAALFFGNGAVCANGVVSKNINGHVVTGREESTQGRHNNIAASSDIYEQMKTEPSPRWNKA